MKIKLQLASARIAKAPWFFCSGLTILWNVIEYDKKEILSNFLTFFWKLLKGKLFKNGKYPEILVFNLFLSHTV